MNRLLFRERAQKISYREATFGALPRIQGTGATRFMIGFLLAVVLMLLLGFFAAAPDRVLLSGTPL